MKQKALILFMIFLLIASGALSAAKSIVWVGCGVTQNAFTRELADAFEKETDIRVIVRGQGALKGIRDAASGRADIGGTCRLSLDIDKEKNVQLHHVAWDAIVFIVSKDNPVNEITSEQVRSIIDGTISNWKALGGKDQKIDFFSRHGNLSGVGHMFRVMFYQDANKEFPRAINKPRSSGLIEKLVAVNDGALALSGAASAHKRSSIKMLALDGVYPSKENIQSGKYHLVRPLYFATGKTPSGESQRFVDFALSEKGQKIIAAEDVVNLSEGTHLLGTFKERFGKKHLAPSLQ